MVQAVTLPHEYAADPQRLRLIITDDAALAKGMEGIVTFKGPQRGLKGPQRGSGKLGGSAMLRAVCLVSCQRDGSRHTLRSCEKGAAAKAGTMYYASPKRRKGAV